MTNRKRSMIQRAVSRDHLPMAVREILVGIPEALQGALTVAQVAQVAEAVNLAYHRGRASTGAEMVDTDAVWVTAWGRIVERPQEEAGHAQ